MGLEWARWCLNPGYHLGELGFPVPDWAEVATVDEIASMVVLLASDRSSYTTGTIVTIDGGMANRGSLI